MTASTYLPLSLPLDPGETDALDDLLLEAVTARRLPPVLLPVVLRVHALNVGSLSPR